ncbi:uncharacterized protein LOC129588825 isoform X2 [Paramacrobiotus metropolitanus]|uniref:uncharacterized protein LOC129588825 isoform X2 n=1 Tax=Paramacrobiotus metropolitanus TaxID=2943436 RepID=UPI002445FD16|nr:uncharacterized protein LOC129588825 isoform X2 [Paramacrobiotus metropolitanus]
MYLYENETRYVYSWNSVDVEMDGLLQHGHIIGLENVEGNAPRLIVDFGCPEQRAVPVDYGKIFDCSANHRTRENSLKYNFKHLKDKLSGALASANDTNDVDVEVLIRNHPSHPWKWYLGELLMLGLHIKEWACVEVMLGCYRTRELLPQAQMRMPLAKAELRHRQLSPGVFVMRLCGVPEEYFLLDSAMQRQFLRELQEEHKLHIEYFCNSTIHYLQRTSARPVRYSTLKSMIDYYRVSIRYPVKVLSIEAHSQNNQMDAECVNADSPALRLPPEILKDVLQSLATIDRQRCRRVCPLWEELLTASERGQDVHVQLAADHWIPHYSAYACLFKCITPVTRTICIRESVSETLRYPQFEDYTVAGQALGYIGKVVGTVGARIERVILSHRRLSNENASRTLPGYLSSLAATYLRHTVWCDRIIWTDYSLSVSAPVYNIHFHIPRAVFRLHHTDALQIWDLFEEHCQQRKLVDMDRITQGTAYHTRSKFSECGQITEILMAYQSSDPRPASSYFQWNWTLEDLDSLDIRKLNKICLCVLSGYVTEASNASSAISETPGEGEEIGESDGKDKP